MAPGISYDDSGSLASYFGVTFLAIILIPVTYAVFRPEKKDALQPLCPCSTCRERSTQLANLKRGRRWKRFTRRLFPLALGWSLLAYLCYRIAQSPPPIGGVVYNPFEILGLSDSSTEKQIKKHYKKLSLLFHPDKIQLAENQTKEDADAKFVELTKAYKSLTDEVTRENLAKYGNPDGPQQREDKIAIPQWVVEGKNNIWILGAYGLILGGLIPFIVGRWWFSQRRLTRDGILNPTAETFFHYLKEDTDFTSLVSLVSCAAEFNSLLGTKVRGSKKQRKERQARIESLEESLGTKKEELLVEEDPSMRKDSRVGVNTAAGRRARALLWAHILRMKLDDEELEAEQIAMLRALPTILTALLNISLARNWLSTSLLVVRLQASLVQALPPNASPLAQLPDLDPEEAFALEMTAEAEGKRWAEKAISKKCLEGEAVQVAQTWPRLEITHAEFKVVGERVVTPSSIVQLAVQARYVYPSTSNTTPDLPKPVLLPNGDGTDHANGPNGDVSTDSVTDVEDEVEKVNGTEEDGVDVKEKVEDLKNGIVSAVEEKEALKAKDAAANRSQVGRKGKKEEKKVYPPNGYAHAPRWPQLRKPHFHVLLGDTKLNKVIVQPMRMTDLPLPRPDGLPSEPREFTLQFQAPPQANLYSFVLYAASDTYLGADVERPIMLKVEEPPSDNELSDDEDISDPEEDTLAGQMAMMRGGKVKASAVHDNDDDDESGSEYEDETSSDEEGPVRGKKAINEDSSDSD